MNTTVLSARLLAAVGLAALPGCIFGGAECGEPPTTTPAELCLDAPRDTADTGAPTCPSADEPGLAAMLEDRQIDICEVASINGEATGPRCCYPVTASCEVWSCCGYGRPLVSDGQARLAAAVPGRAWHARGLALPDVRGLSASERAVAAAFWRHNMLSEHSSIGGFHRFVLDLMAHGAPPSLIRRAQSAANEETAHTRACAALASAYAGADEQPGPLPIGASAPVARDLVELAAATVHDGCIGETLAAYLAEAIAERATDPAVKAVMSRIARDEAGHAAIAWATLRWALAEGGGPVVEEVAARFAAMRYAPPAPDPAVTERLRAHGLLPQGEIDALVTRCMERGIRPLAAALLGSAARAAA